MYIGNHLSSTKGFEHMGKEALKLDANTFAFFTRNPRGGAAKEIDPEDALRLRKLMEEHHFGILVAHAPYTMNLCAGKEDVRKFSKEVISDDIKRMGNDIQVSSLPGQSLGPELAMLSLE